MSELVCWGVAVGRDRDVRLYVGVGTTRFVGKEKRNRYDQRDQDHSSRLLFFPRPGSFFRCHENILSMTLAGEYLGKSRSRQAPPFDPQAPVAELTSRQVQEPRDPLTSGPAQAYCVAMLYGHCTKCRHEVTIGGDRCAFCGEPLPLVAPPGANDGTAKTIAEQPALLSVGVDEIAPTAAITAEQLASIGAIPGASAGSDVRGNVPETGPVLQNRSTTAIDMRHLLDSGAGANRDEIGTPVRVRAGAMRYPSTTLSETDIEGLDPVRIARTTTAAGSEVQSRHALLRTWPLLLVVGAGLTALVIAGWHIGGPGEVDTDPDALDARVVLDAGEFTLGLTDENKNTVLQMCFRVSTNPNYQCRQSQYEALGEFPERVGTFDVISVDVYEVSNRRYEACVVDGICPTRDQESCEFYTHRSLQVDAIPPDRMFGLDYPAICVNREEAETFCRWVGGRLPTPDEWERAARSGDDRLAPWGTLWAPDLINWAETEMGGFPVVGHLDGYDLSAPVDHFDNGATPEGLLNMLGNVAEWVAASESQPDGVRGGSYRNDLRDLRLTRQWDVDAIKRRSDVGFRCVYEQTD